MLPKGLPERTLGWDILDWGTQMLAQPDENIRYAPGENWQYSNEQAMFLLWFYAVDELGRYVYRNAVLERPKGWGKSPLLAAICCTELLGPVVFDGWGADGRPIGRPARTPLVQIAAISDSQANNTMDLVRQMLAEGDAPYYFPQLEINLSKITYPGGKKLEKVTASPRGREGNRATFIVMDEQIYIGQTLPTPSGWKTVGDIAVGDIVFDEFGNQTPVVKVTPIVNDRDCYRVRWADGDSMIVSSGHLWYTKVAASAALPKVRTTEEMYQSFHKNGKRRKFMTPRAGAAQYPHRALSTHPYILGLWLGDGDRDTPILSVGLQDEEAIRKILGDLNLPSLWESRDPRTQVLRYRFGFKKDWNLPYFDKHIPEEYLISSEEQRIALLQGLMDSDGWISKDDNYAVFVNQNERLSKDVLELVRSLGLSASLTSRLDDRYEDKRVYKVGFRPDRNDVVRLPRKSARIKGGDRQSEWMSFTIEPVPTVPTKCIGIDTPTNLFLVGGYKVTHNTHL